MKTIFLLRHAKSSWDDPDLADFDRPLSGRGKEAAEAMADQLRERKIAPDLVLCSAARRARATLKRIRPGLAGKPETVVDEALYHAGAGALMERLQALDDGVRSVMVVGHNPTLETLARDLAGDGDAEALARMAAKFPTGALAVLETEAKRWRDVKARGARLVAFFGPRDFG